MIGKRPFLLALALLPAFVVPWIAVSVVKLGAAIAGPLAIAFMYRLRAVTFDNLPAWTKPWANPEDWRRVEIETGPLVPGGKRLRGVNELSLPDWWKKEKGSGFFSWWWYHAIRNPANGLRSFESLDLDLDKDQVRYWTPYLPSLVNSRVTPVVVRPGFYEPKWLRLDGKRAAFYIAWQGFRAGFKFLWIWNEERHLEIRFGWRVEPRDAFGSVDRALPEDTGFAWKFLPWRKG